MVCLGVFIFALVASLHDAHRDGSKATESALDSATQTSKETVAEGAEEQLSQTATSQANGESVMNATAYVASDLTVNATNQAQLALEASFHSTVDRLQKALQEERRHIMARKKTSPKGHAIKVHHTSKSKQSSVAQIDNTQLEKLLAENNELRRQQAQSKVADVEAEI